MSAAVHLQQARPEEMNFSPLTSEERKDSLSVQVAFVKFHISRSRKLNFDKISLESSQNRWDCTAYRTPFSHVLVLMALPLLFITIYLAAQVQEHEHHVRRRRRSRQEEHDVRAVQHRHRHRIRLIQVSPVRASS